jgi:hypothetical protein
MPSSKYAPDENRNSMLMPLLKKDFMLGIGPGADAVYL